MPQTKLQSLVEAASNTFTAFLLSLLAHRFIVAPLTEYYVIDMGGDFTDWILAFLITLFYTALSLGRNFVIRVMWERHQSRRSQ